MPMTHVPEIGTEKGYQKTGTINRHENKALFSVRYQKPVPEKFGTKLRVRRCRNRYRFSDNGFRAPISDMCVIGLTFYSAKVIIECGTRDSAT